VVGFWDEGDIGFVDLCHRHIRIQHIQNHICNIRAYNVLVSMEKDNRHIVGSEGFCWVDLLQRFDYLISSESFSELCVNVFHNTSQDKANNFINSGGVGGGVDFLKVSHSSGCNIFFAFTPLAIIIPEPHNSVRFPSFRHPSMEEFGILVPLSVLVNLVALVPHGFFIV